MKSLLLTIIALSSPFAQAAYTPPVQRYQAVFYEGHSGQKDESPRYCNLDIILIREDVGKPFWVMLMLASDSISQISFRALIPTEILPLKDGTTWTDFMGRSYSYKNGVLASDDGELRYQIDGRFLFPSVAEGRSQPQNGLSGNFLRCEF